VRFAASGYNRAVPDEDMDVDAVLEKLNRCLSLQYRSVLQQTLTSGSLFGFEFQSLGDRIWKDADAEIDDLRLLVEKIAALGGTPTTDVAELRWTGDPSDAVQWLVDTETELVDSLKDAITPTGQEGRSEALEHVLEHIIMRKQNQIDFLLRARRTA
jgi:bacterioferritin (cytochrome b1)